MIRLLLVLAVAAALSSAAEPAPIHLWPHGAPGEAASLGPEKDTTKPSDKPVAGRPVIRLGDVSDPTITVYRAAKPADTHPAVIVFPGGGYQILAMNIEGTEICQWLNAHGITAVLLKYRVPRRKGLPPYEAPLQDAQRAVSIVRSRAGEWKIAPERIGVMGFSAGGNLAALTSTRFNERAYANVDAADRVSCRPDFAVLIYPAYLTKPEGSSTIAPELTIHMRSLLLSSSRRKMTPYTSKTVLPTIWRSRTRTFPRKCICSAAADMAMASVPPAHL